MQEEMSILGIDPGIANTGWAILRCSGSNDYKVLDSGLITTKPKWPVDRRIKKIVETLSKSLSEVDIAAIESAFFMPRAPSVITTVMVIGGMMWEAHRQNVPIYEVNPLTVKQTVGLKKTSSKDEMMLRAKMIFGLEVKKSKHHIADAACVALAGQLKHKLEMLERQKNSNDG